MLKRISKVTVIVALIIGLFILLIESLVSKEFSYKFTVGLLIGVVTGLINLFITDHAIEKVRGSNDVPLEIWDVCGTEGGN